MPVFFILVQQMAQKTNLIQQARIGLLMLSFVVLLFEACTWEHADPQPQGQDQGQQNPGDTSNKDTISCAAEKTNLSFTTDIQPITKTYCAFSSCHPGFTEYDNFKVYIQANEPDNSLAYQYIESGFMPYQTTTGPEEVDSCDRATLKEWIQQGAQP